MGGEGNALDGACRKNGRINDYLFSYNQKIHPMLNRSLALLFLAMMLTNALLAQQDYFQQEVNYTIKARCIKSYLLFPLLTTKNELAISQIS